MKGDGAVQGIVAKIGHICRVVKDSEVSTKFYTSVIGCQPLNRPKFGSNGYWLWLGNTQLHLIQVCLLSFSFLRSDWSDFFSNT